MFSLSTFESVAASRAAPTTGFDYLRVGLALAVVVVHCANIADHEAWRWMWTSWVGPFERLILPAFFALSGYLVTGSLLRNSLPHFVALRVFRIVPALGVEVALTALLLGSLVTTLHASTYFTSPEFWSYLSNIIGNIHYTLPGVFDGKQLNVQLWTIPFEFECYALMVGLALTGLVRRKTTLFLLFVTVTLALTTFAFSHSFYQEGWNVPGRMLVAAFVCGILLFLFRSAIPHAGTIAIFSAMSVYVLLRLPNLVFLAALPIAYLTVYVGLLRPKAIPFGDLSYGIYLFHFPIARTLDEASAHRLSWASLLSITLILTGVFAFASWHLIEKPVLARKKNLLRQVDVMASFVAARIRKLVPSKLQQTR